MKPEHDALPGDSHENHTQFLLLSVVQTYLQYGASEKVRKELLKWRMAKQEVEINADAAIVLKLEQAN